ncbi:hypothetical protein [Paenarthrobacter ureafaciens]|uniref:hypothetical protein n=1 Tax=Paenarthrobacter ureafaciens TaxID=37931 RepID=UPI003463894B
MPEADAGSSARWAKAAARAEGLTDLGIRGAVRRYYLLHFPITVLIAFGLAFFFASLWPPERASILVTGASFGLMLAGLGSGITGFIYGSKKIGPMVQPHRMGVTVGLTADEVKRVRRQVIGKEPVDVDLRVLRGAAVQIREGLARQFITLPGFTLLFWGQALNRGVSSTLDVIFLIALLAMMVTLGYLVRQFHQTGVFLTMTATSASDDLM